MLARRLVTSSLILLAGLPHAGRSQPVAAGSAEPPTHRTVTVQLDWLNEGLDDAPLELRAQSGDQVRVGERREGRFLFDLPSSEVWTLACEGETFWCPEIEVDPATTSRVQLPVARAAWFTGHFHADESLPASFVVQGWFNRAAEPAMAFRQDVGAPNDKFRFRGPELPVDLRLAVGGFSPVYFWDAGARESGDGTEARDGELAELSLGRIQLQPGGSLCGFVSAAATGHLLKGAQVVLSVEAPRVGSPRTTANRFARMQWKTRTNERGFFQLVGPPSGTYRLEIRPEGPGLVPLEVRQLDLSEEAETCLEDLEVRQPIEVAFHFDPAVGPNGQPWHVRLNPKSKTGIVAPDSLEPVDSGGSVRFRISPGRFDLLVFAPDTRTRVLRKSVELHSTESRSLALDLVPLEGRILLGEEPLLAKVRFNVEDGFQATWETNFDGEFSGLIPRPNGQTPIVQVSSALYSFSRWLEIDEIPMEGGVARLDFEFEERSLSGTVRSEGGKPVRRATVVAMPLDSNVGVTAETDVDGRFELVGLDAEPLRLSAEAKGFGSSRSVQLEPWGDGHGPEIELVLEPGVPLRGQVFSGQATPIPGAHVTLVIPGTHSAIRSTTSGMDGTFELQVPESATRAVAQVLVPSLVSWSACVDLPRSGDLLRLSSPSSLGGTLVFRHAPVEDAFSAPYLLTSDGGVLSIGSLFSVDLEASREVSESSEDGEVFRFRISSMAAGLYSAIHSSEGPVRLAARACGGDFSSSDWQLLPEGGEVELIARPTR